MNLEESIARSMARDPEFARIWEERRPLREFSLALIGARIARGMTQYDLADAAGLPRSTVTRLEAGEANPTVKTLGKLSAALGVSFEIDATGVHVGQELAAAR
jgi:transcriptional regulator with XRE-family HTH domain